MAVLRSLKTTQADSWAFGCSIAEALVGQDVGCILPYGWFDDMECGVIVAGRLDIGLLDGATLVDCGRL